MTNWKSFLFLYTQLCLGNDVLEHSFFRSKAVISILEPGLLSCAARFPFTLGHLIMFQRATLQGRTTRLELVLNCARRKLMFKKYHLHLHLLIV